MLLRLILVLMLAIGAPAMPAMGHDGMQPMAMAGHEMPDRQHKAPMPQHFCIGCVPMGDWNAIRVWPPMALPAPAPLSRIAALVVLPNRPPIPPPPRNA
jgi:hypothetical protein